MYWYGMRLRGFSPACQPKGVKEVREDRKYWNVIGYERKLTDEEEKEYELDYLPDYSERGFKDAEH